MSEIFKHTGSLLDVQEGILIHGCNSKGVMGSGIAKSIKEMYPKAFRDYTQLLDQCRTTANKMGKLSLTEIKARKLYIGNLITQENYGTDKGVVYVSYDALSRALRDVGYYAQHYGLDVHFPLIGCGLANGDWGRVEEIINKVLPKSVRKHLWVLPETN